MCVLGKPGRSKLSTQSTSASDLEAQGGPAVASHKGTQGKDAHPVPLPDAQPGVHRALRPESVQGSINLDGKKSYPCFY